MCNGVRALRRVNQDSVLAEKEAVRVERAAGEKINVHVRRKIAMRSRRVEREIFVRDEPEVHRRNE